MKNILRPRMRLGPASSDRAAVQPNACGNRADHLGRFWRIHETLPYQLPFGVRFLEFFPGGPLVTYFQLQ